MAVTLPRPRRYSAGARFYDVLSGERPVYRAGRVAAIEELSLKPGARVLDVGCGTGLNFPLLAAAIGAGGSIVGVDASAEMLAQAQTRATRYGWVGARSPGSVTVDLLHGDAASLLPGLDPGFDAVLFTYSLSIIDDWQACWRAALDLLVDGGRVAVADTAMPTGAGRLLAPLAGLAMLSGGVHSSRRVWEAVLRDTTDTTERVLRSGHIYVTAGSVASSGATGIDQ